MLSSTAVRIGDRYTLEDKLGEGGMGTVFRAYDRLTGQFVALKQVRSIPARSNAASSMDLRLALAREFQLLASLRHPHIISVLDYSFDAEKRPYFTMNLLVEPQDILEFAQQQDTNSRIQLLIQVLQALSYLHRRGIAHRDLKPSNILVNQDGVVRVLDFGLAVEQGKDKEVVGTLQYMAPEVLQGEGASIEADLYAVGLIAYELLTGQHPFQTVNAAQLIMDILGTEPDLSLLPRFDSATLTLPEVLSKLLAKNPAVRYHTADSTIHDLCAATGLPVPEENAEIRESFLQAANFIGRDTELQQLLAAFGEAANGRGSLWLIGGESGVGKSRLLDELRIRALVSNNEAGGTIVLQGQAVEAGGRPYYMWREPLRRLLLSTPLEDTLEASILKAIVPDIGDLIGMDVADAPTLSGQAQHERLFLTILNLFRRQKRPVLLILEDLHWANENLNPVKIFSDAIKDLPLLMIGSYRDDEKPELPQLVPFGQPVKLHRFDEADVSQLSASILGEAGQQKSIIDLLQRETEGNVFFLVEVIRTLAEEAGSLSNIGRATLPIRVFAGGVQSVIRHRLGKLPLDAQRLLRRAALIGRRIDRRVLETLVRRDDYAGMRDLDAWFTLCGSAAILEPIGSEWRFAHDKLRATVIADLDESERVLLYREVAEAIETTYPDNPDWAMALVEHWRGAGVPEKEVYYTVIAAEQALMVSAFQEALTMSERALSLLPETGAEKQRLALLRHLGDAQQSLGNYKQALDYFQQCLALSQQMNDQQGYLRTLINFGAMYLRLGDLETAKEYLHQGLSIARVEHDERNLAVALNNLGMIAWQQNDFPLSTTYLTESLEIARRIGHVVTVSASLSNLGIVAWQQGDYDLALKYVEESGAVARSVGDRRSVVLSYVNLGGIAGEKGEPEAARDYLAEGVALARTIGDKRGLVLCLINLGEIMDRLREVETGRAYLQEALSLAQSMGDALNTAFARFYLGLGYFRSQEYSDAQPAFAQALQGFEQIGYGLYIAQAHTMLGHGMIRQGDLNAAQIHLAQALSQAETIHNVNQQLFALTGYIHLLIANGKPEQSAELLGLVESRNEVLDQWIRDWIITPARDYLESSLSSEVLLSAIQRGAQRDLNEVIEQLRG